jgi:hypothetical protein
MMRQYWTPMARLLGLHEPTKAGEDTDPLSKNRIQENQANTHWPLLFEAFRRQALDEWVPACKRHEEVNPEEKLALYGLTITPKEPLIANQLAQWKQEGTQQDLIRWLVKGPWDLPDIYNSMDFAGFETLTINDMELPTPQDASSRFDWRSAADKSAQVQTHWEITVRTSWIKPVENPPSEVLSDVAAVSWQTLLTDAASVRRLPPLAGLVILGKEKTVRMPDGQLLELKDRLPIRWEEQTAVYAAVNGAYVSGLHLALRAGPDGIECQDLSSSNGSFIGDQRLAPGKWTVLPARTRIFLGGTLSDLRADAPSLEITGKTGNHPVSLVATPLHLPTNRDCLLIDSAKPSHPVSVKRLPFLIGRDPQCDWVVGTDNMMVSRMHLRIEQIDLVAGRILVMDLSRQGLTRCDGNLLEVTQTGTWIPVGSELVLGQTPDHEGLAFRLRRPSGAD